MCAGGIVHTIASGARPWIALFNAAFGIILVVYVLASHAAIWPFGRGLGLSVSVGMALVGLAMLASSGLRRRQS